MKHRVSASAAAIGSLLAAGTAYSGPIYSFEQWTTNGNALVASQLFVEVLSYSGGVEFKFSNSGPIASTISGIYFDDASPLVLGASSFNNTYNAGLAFSEEGPVGFGLSGFDVDRYFDADPPPPQNGINIGEAFGVRFALSGGTTVADIADLLDGGDLRIGLHVISIDGGGSEKFVTTTVIPLPQGVGLAAAGLLAIGARRRRSL